MTRLYLIRHAEAQGNIARVFHGQFDSDITPNGQKQLSLLSKRFETIDYDAVYSSDLKRAHKTAQAVVGQRAMDIALEKDLREINGGDWENLPFEKIATEYTELFEIVTNTPHLLELPNGESAIGLQTRIKNKIFDLVKKNPKKAICVTSHGMAIKSFLCYAHGMDLANMRQVKWCDNTAVSAMDFSDIGDITFVWENDNSHLDEQTSTVMKQRWWQKENQA